MVPSWRKSASLSWSVSVVAEMPASGPRQGREPAASEGSGICPGIMSDPATTAAVGGEKRGRGGLALEKRAFREATDAENVMQCSDSGTQSI